MHSPSPDVAWAVGDFRDENGGDLAFILRTTDGGQTWENLSDNIVSVERDEETVPEQFRLFQNYPNPFNPGTTIRYEVHDRGRVTLKIYNVLGEEIRTLVNEVQAPGGHSVRWDGKNRNGVEVASGIYVSRLQVGERVETRKMLLVR